MPATACFKSRPLRKISEEDKLTQLDANFPYRRRDVVERDEFAGVRPFQCEFEVRQKLFVDVADQGWNARRRGRFGGGGEGGDGDGLGSPRGVLRIGKATP